MSQNNDQSRPTPSQSWYDNGQVPQSKKFPFGAGAGGDESATRMSPQIDQNGQGNTPPYGQQPATSGSQAPQFGDGQNFGGTAPGGQNYGGQNYGGSQPGNQPYADNGQGQPQQYQQPAQPQSGQGQHYGENGSGQFDPNQGGQPEYGQNQPQQGYGQPQSGQPQGDPAGGQQDQMSDSGRQQFQGILDPHTGEIHPVPDLDARPREPAGPRHRRSAGIRGAARRRVRTGRRLADPARNRCLEPGPQPQRGHLPR